MTKNVIVRIFGRKMKAKNVDAGYQKYHNVCPDSVLVYLLLGADTVV